MSKDTQPDLISDGNSMQKRSTCSEKMTSAVYISFAARKETSHTTVASLHRFFVSSVVQLRRWSEFLMRFLCPDIPAVAHLSHYVHTLTSSLSCHTTASLHTFGKKCHYANHPKKWRLNIAIALSQFSSVVSFSFHLRYFAAIHKIRNTKALETMQRHMST